MKNAQAVLDLFLDFISGTGSLSGNNLPERQHQEALTQRSYYKLYLSHWVDRVLQASVDLYVNKGSGAALRGMWMMVGSVNWEGGDGEGRQSMGWGLSLALWWDQGRNLVAELSVWLKGWDGP